ncbi:MAG: hypothetical protein A2X12_09320 [Bacteroidetes bacterium GWE2_29_8]|nr:MAG: hypothetical protein A2X12_09320 [Bacteroidetes bacterium GWE2_29_8]OFY16198.1 MAG: hypothetical protein A2X02_04265 [Bacteroidetes bacterium GWF2_29_10]
MELSAILNKLKIVGIAFIVVMLIGTLGYKVIAPENGLFECFYMVAITVSTIGYGEFVLKEAMTPESMFAIRLFTIFVAFTGIGILTYLLSTVAALIVEGQLKQTFLIKSMEKKINNLEGHYIICGMTNVGMNISHELFKTKRDFVFTDTDPNKVNHTFSNHKDYIGLSGDCIDDNFLLKLGIKKASGVFITTADDNLNLVIALSVRNLNKDIKIIAMCNDIEYIPKLNIVGVNKIISPSFIGGLRMASEMIRPNVTSFLDEMMRGVDIVLRVEEVKLRIDLFGKKFSEVSLNGLKNTIVMALRENGKWVFNPEQEHIIGESSVLIVMTSPEDRLELIQKYGMH